MLSCHRAETGRTALSGTIIIIFVVVNLYLSHNPILAQSPTPDEFAPIYGSEISGAEWTADSKTFIFYPGKPTKVASDIGWNTFDTQTRNLTRSKTWPLLPPLTFDELGTFGLTSGNYKIGDPLYFLAPDGKTLVFARQVDCGEESCLYHLVLADRGTKEVFDTDTDVYYPFSLDSFRVIWNNSGTAFALMQAQDFADNAAVLTTYVTGFSAGISHSQATPVSSIRLNDTNYKSVDAFTFSRDDSRLLIRTMLRATGQFSLIVYNLASPSQSVLVPDQYGDTAVAAGFAPASQNKILIFNSMGLIQYDLTDGQAVVLNSTLDSVHTVMSGWFSPDGNWFAYQSKGRLLYVLRLVTQTADVFTPTAANTPTPITINKPLVEQDGRK